MKLVEWVIAEHNPPHAIVGDCAPLTHPTYLSGRGAYNSRGATDGEGQPCRRKRRLKIRWRPGSTRGLSVVIHAAEGGGYWAEVPAFAGAVYAEGETAEEARRNAEAALAEYFAPGAAAGRDRRGARALG